MGGNKGKQTLADFVYCIENAQSTIIQSMENRRKECLVTLTSLSDSDFESSNISLKGNKPDGVGLNSNGIDYSVRKTEGKIVLFCKTV